MLRLVEVALFLSPFAAFAMWRLLAPAGGPSRMMIGIGAGVLALLAGSLLWLRMEDAAPAEAVYVPSHLQDGRVEPAHSEPR